MIKTYIAYIVNNKLKKFISVLAAAIFLISSLASCAVMDGSTGTSKSSAKQEKANTVTDISNSKTPAEPVEIGIYINHTLYPQKEWKGPIPEEVTKRTGVKLKFTIASDDKQLLLLIASGDLPEMIFADYSYFKRLSDYRLCYSWNKLIELYAPDFSIDKKRSALYTVSDGNFYTILDQYGTEAEWNAEKYAMPTGGGLCFRRDLLWKLGNPGINSLGDLDRVLDMAKNQYQGLTPLIMNTNMKGAYIAQQYGLSMNKGFVEDSQGKILYYIKQQGMLDYYKTMNLFYRKGYIDPKNYVYKNEEESYEMAVSGKGFAFMDMNGSADKLNIKSKAEGTDYKFVQLVEPISDRAAYYNTSIGWSGVFITKNNKHPKEAINLMKFLSSKEGQRLSYWGEEGRHWTMNSNGYPEFSINTGDDKALVSEGMKWSGLFANNAITEGLFNYNPKLAQTAAAAAEIKKRTIYRPELGLLLPDVNTPENSIKSRVDEMIKNEEIKIYLAKSEEDCVKAYNNMLMTAEQLGLSKLENWADSEYSGVKALFK